MKKVVIGLDVDITKIGMSIVSWSGKLLFSKRIVPSKTAKFFERTVDLVEQLNILLLSYSKKYHIKCVAIEDYGAFFVQRTMAQKGEIIGIIKWLLLQYKLNCFEYDIDKKKKNKVYHERLMIGPSKLKKFIFGKGNVNKAGKSSDLKLLFYKDTDIENISDDEIDAFYLALFAITVLKYDGIKYDENFEIQIGNKKNKLPRNKFDSFSEILKVIDKNKYGVK